MFVHQTLARATRLYGSSEAVACGDVRLTYRQLDERVGRLAGVMVGAGVAPGDRVAVLMLNCHRYMECYFAAERAGAVLQPLNHRLAPAELAYALNDARTTMLVVDAALASMLDACRPQLTTLPQVLVTGSADDQYELALERATPVAAPVRDWTEDDLLHLYYTSGTTGRAKGVMLSQRNVLSNAEHALFAHRFTERDVWLHAAPMFHLADAWACWTVTWLGGRHVFLREFNPAAFLELVERERVTATLIVPTMINAIVNAPEVTQRDTASLRLITFGASPMPVDRLRAAMAALPCDFSQLYGMTETAPFAAQLMPEDIRAAAADAALAGRLASCGREIPGVAVRVWDIHGRDVRPSEVGEIVMRGANIMLGYWERPQETAHALRDGWMHSGDLAMVDGDGYITIVDRAKDMIITGGENVYSTEVEDALYHHVAVLEAAVIGVPDDRWGERVHAVVVLRPGMAAAAGELADSCRRYIAGFKIPRSVEFVEALPKTGSGKIQKAEIRERYWHGRERRVN